MNTYLRIVGFRPAPLKSHMDTDADTDQTRPNSQSGHFFYNAVHSIISHSHQRVGAIACAPLPRAPLPYPVVNDRSQSERTDSRRWPTSILP